MGEGCIVVVCGTKLPQAFVRYDSLLSKTPTKFKPFSIETTLFLALGRPQGNSNRDFEPLNLWWSRV